jgi:hypothetical protein
MSCFIKIRPVGAELFHADGQTDGQTDMTKIMVAFSNFANAPKDRLSLEISISLSYSEGRVRMREKMPDSLRCFVVLLSISRYVPYIRSRSVPTTFSAIGCRFTFLSFHTVQSEVLKGF